MIRFDLTCDKDHRFDSWFASNAAFDALKAAGHLSCAICGSTKVRKNLMSPQVRTKTARDPLGQPDDTSVIHDTGAKAEMRPAPTAADPIAAIKQQVEATSDYVGLSFAAEARAMHEGDIPERPIYGEANSTEARKLIADGVPVLPLPFIPTKKAN